MFLTNTALTPATLLTLLDNASEEIKSHDIRVVNVDTLRSNIEGLIKQEPANLFGDLIGLTREEAADYIKARCNGDGGRNRANTILPLVSTTTVFFEDGRETAALYERTNALRGTSGMITGKGLGVEYDLVVSITDGKISEIIHYGE